MPTTFNTDFISYVQMLEKRLARLERATFSQGDQNDTTFVNTLTITGFAVTNQTVVLSTQETTVRVRLNWDEINADPNALNPDPVAAYLLSYTIDGTNYTAEVAATAPPVTFEQFALGTSVTFRIRARTKKNVLGPYATLNFTTTTDNTAVPQPSTPVVSSYLGQLAVSWDGKDVSAQAMPIDFQYLEVHVSTSSGFAPGATTIRGTIISPTGGQFVVSGLTYGTLYYVRTVAVDRVGNRSVSSTQASGTPERVTGADIANGQIPTSALPFRDDGGNVVPDGSFESTVERSTKAALHTDNPSRGGYSNTPGDAYHGDWCWETTYSSVSPANYYLTGAPYTTVRPGEKFFVRVASKTKTGTVASATIVLRWWDEVASDYTLSSVAISGTSSWVETSTVVTVPNDVSRLDSVYLTWTNLSGGGTFQVDIVEVRKQIGTALIENLAVTNAKIADLAVDNAKIANLDAGKVTTGTLDANRIGVGAIAARELGTGYGDNIFPDPGFEEPDWRTLRNSHSAFFRPSGTHEWTNSTLYDNSTYQFRWTSGASGGSIVWHGGVSCTPGERIYAACRIAKESASVDGAIRIVLWPDGGSWIEICTSNGMTINADGWYHISGSAIIPDNVTGYSIYMEQWGTTVTGWRCDDIEVRRVVGSAGFGRRVEISPLGFFAYDPLPEEDPADQVPVISLGTSSDDYLALTDAAGENIASISREGYGTFQRVEVVGADEDADELKETGLTIYGRQFLEWLSDLPRGVIAWENFGSDKGPYSTETGYGEIGCTVYPDRLYRISFRVRLDNTTATGGATAHVRRTLSTTSTGDAAAPLTTSQQLIGSPISYGSQTGGADFFCYDEGFFYLGLTEPRQMRLLLTIAPSGGGTIYGRAGSSSGVSDLNTTGEVGIQLAIEDIGPYIAQSGAYNLGGGSGAVPPQTYTKTWTASWTEQYQGDNSANSYYGSDTAVQGYYSSNNGNQRSLIGFPSTIASTLSDTATINKVEVYLYFNHWYYNSGGTAVIGVHGHTSAPGTFSGTDNVVQSGNWPKPGGRWVTLPSAYWNGWRNGTYRGIVLGPGPSTSKTYYGKANGSGASSSKPQLRIKYTQ